MIELSFFPKINKMNFSLFLNKNSINKEGMSHTHARSLDCRSHKNQLSIHFLHLKLYVLSPNNHVLTHTQFFLTHTHIHTHTHIALLAEGKHCVKLGCVTA